MEAARRNREIVAQVLRSNAGPYIMKNLVDEYMEAEQANRFLLIRTGWHRGEDYYALIQDVGWREDGTVIIYADNTDEDLAEELIEAGIPADKVLKAYDFNQSGRLNQGDSQNPLQRMAA